MKKCMSILVMIITIGLVSLASADVTIKHKTVTEALGANVISNSAQYIKGDKSKNITETISKMPANPMMGGGGKMTDTDINITRLDKGVNWQINENEMTYIETSLDKPVHDESENTPHKGEKPDFMNSDKFEWKMKVTDIKDTETISGYKCKGIKGVATGTHKLEPEKKMRMSFTYWYSSDLSGYSELKSFYDKQENISGKSYYDFGEGDMLGGFGNQMKEISDKLKDIDGLPVQVEIQASGSFNPMSDMMPEGMGGMDTENMPPQIKEMMNQMMEKMKPKQTEDGMYIFLNSTTTIESVETNRVDDSEFELPEDYKKVD